MPMRTAFGYSMLFISHLLRLLARARSEQLMRGHFGGFLVSSGESVVTFPGL